MKKSLLIELFAGVLLIMTLNTNCLVAQVFTVPDYSYGAIQSQYGLVTQAGVASPGPSGGYTTGEAERTSGIFLAKGYRWWSYPDNPELICTFLPHFDFPGLHGLFIYLATVGCINPPIGHMASWGGIIANPENRKIWCLNGVHHLGGPTAQYCIPFGSGQICYPVPSNWGYGDSYGYLRKVVVIQSSGSLKTGDPVSIKATITAQRIYEGEETVSSKGVLFMNKPSQAPWWKMGMGKDYLAWGDVKDILGTPSKVNNMLAKIEVNQNNTDDSTVTVAIGDTIILELMFNNSIKHVNTGTGEGEGWIGNKPGILFSNYNYARTDSIKKIIKNNGNSLSYDLVSLTTGALLNPLTPGGPNVDEDKDGISDVREKGADGTNSTFDGNSDAIPDYKQANAASFLTYNGGNYVTLTVPAGTELSQLKVTDNPSPSDTPADAQFPWGFFDFSIDGLDLGEAVTVTLILHNAEPVGKYYKYGMTPDIKTSHWYEFTYDGQTGAQINGNVITLHFVDGLRGDEDITVNGSIKEPGGPAKTGTTGISGSIEKTGIIVYPNPVSDYITLKLNNILPGDNYLLNIYSNTGEIIQQKLINVCDANEEFVIPAAQLVDGMYLITLSGEKQMYKAKFIKLR